MILSRAGWRARVGRHPRALVALGCAVAVGIALVVVLGETQDPAAAGSPGVSADSRAGVFTGSGVEITDGAAVGAAGFSPLTVRIPGTAAQTVKLVVDGTYLGTDTSRPYTFAVAAVGVGKHKLRYSIRDAAGGSTEVRMDFTVAGGSTSLSTTRSSPPGPSPTTSTTGGGPGTGQVVVTDAASLQKAMAAARPGTTITLRDGTYSGKEVRDPTGREPGRFLATASGTAAAPIVLQGSRNAVLDGGGTGGGYAVHLKGASYWRLQGFTVRSAAKGIVLDSSGHNVIDGVHVTDIGAEGIHFRDFSSDNLLTNSTVDDTGVKSPNFGEGVYIGSARSNWGTNSGGRPDGSDRNQIVDNQIFDTRAENIDIKEGSSNGVVRGNTLGGDKIASKNSADSWIDVKGNGYLIASNHGETAPRPGTTECGDPQGDPTSVKNPFCDGIQVHVILAGWGQRNTFTGNTLEVNAPGAGIWLQNTAVPLGNVIRCDNEVTGAAAGAYATNHYTALTCTP